MEREGERAREREREREREIEMKRDEERERWERKVGLWGDILCSNNIKSYL